MGVAGTGGYWWVLVGTSGYWWVLEKGAAMPVGEGARWTVVDCSGWLLMMAMALPSTGVFFLNLAVGGRGMPRSSSALLSSLGEVGPEHVPLRRAGLVD